MLKIRSHVFQPTHLRRGGSDWIPEYIIKVIIIDYYMQHTYFVMIKAKWYGLPQTESQQGRKLNEI